MHKAKIGIISLGCPRNLVDSEKTLGRLREKGYKIVDMQEADIGIVNTCSFIKEAKEESIETILSLIELKKERKLKKVIVYGCLAQHYKEELIPHLKEIDAFVGRISFDGHKPSERYFLTPSHYAYVKISEGCNNACSYCVIPKIKGPLSCNPVDAILSEVRVLDKKGVCEINIIGQDITLYRSDYQKKDIKLLHLLREVVAIVKNIKWIRLLYTHPAHISDDLIDFIARQPRMCKYIDLPIQHINEKILKKMNRKVTKNEIISLIERFRTKIPNLSIRTSVIVGFPGETEDDFNELLGFIQKQKFERLGAFMYSREEGTAAYNFKNQIPEKTKRKRLDIIMKKQQEIASEVNGPFLDKEIEVLIDEKGSSDNIYLARTQGDAPEVDGLVYVRAKGDLKPGDFVKVKITDTYEYDLVGEQI